MKLRSISLVLVAIFAAIVMTCALAAGGKTQKLYKWVDKNGVVHYGSSVPPEYANQQMQVLNDQGVTVKTIAAPKTPEEIAKEKQEKAEAAAKAKQLKQQQANDQMLLDTYTSVADIKRDRDSRLTAIESQIKFINSSISSLQSAQANYQKQEEKLTKEHKKITASLKNDMVTTQDQLATSQKLLLEQQQNEQQVKDRYADYIKRYQQLTGQSSPSGGS